MLATTCRAARISSFRHLALCVLLCLCSATCQRGPMPATAFQARDRAQLFGGGPRALGDAGDFVLMNDQVRVVVQNAGFSRGFGVYGGGIIDADLRRFDEQGRGASNAQGGHDIFAEMFSSFFFQAVNCDKVEVLADGTKPYEGTSGTTRVRYDAGVAVVRASGGGGEFLTLLKLFGSLFLNYLLPTAAQSQDGTSELVRLGVLLGLDFPSFAAEMNKLTNENARYEIDYVLRPGARHVEIRARMINKTKSPLAIPSAVLANPTFRDQVGGADLSSLRVPVGSVLLYGRLNNVFLPGTGYDLRHPLERSFKRGLPLPAFAGVITEFIASASTRLDDRVSYGLLAAESDNNFVYQNAALYRDAGKFKDTFTPLTRGSLLIPFTAISFIGAFSDSYKGTLAPGGTFEQLQHFIIGGGDVASIADEVAVIRGATTGSYQGILRESQGGQPSRDGQLVIYQDLELTSAAFPNEDDYLDAGLRLCGLRSPTSLCRPYSQDYPDDAGNLGGSLPPGRYAYRVQGPGRVLGPFVFFVIEAGKATALDPRLPPPGRLQVLVTDQAGRPLPAKVSVLSQYDQPYSNPKRRSGGAFDIQAGEPYRFSDMLPDTVANQRSIIEATGFTNADGQASLTVRPGRYRVVFSRGFEYDLASVDVEVPPGNAARASGQLHRVVDTSGWLSMDGHVHGENSIDSSMALRDRVLSAAGEGVEIAISTDHNFISDWRPLLDSLRLRPWMTSFVGIEFTTLESGHFNSFPLNYQVGPVTHGAFEWFGRPPEELFAGLRKIAEPNQTNIIVCNHPRDSTQGYFNQYGRSSITGDFVSQGTSKRLAGPNGLAFYDAQGKNQLSYKCDAIEIVNGKLGHEIHSVRVPKDWPAACYQPLPAGFDPKKDLDPCSLNGKILRPASVTGALVPGTVLIDTTPSAPPGMSGLDNVEAVFPGAVTDWFNMLNQGLRHTGVATSDSHAAVGEEVGSARTFLRFGHDDPTRVDTAALVDAVVKRKAATLSNGPFLTFTVARGTEQGGDPIGSDVVALDGKVAVNYRLAAPPWVSVDRIHVYVNGKLFQRIPVDPDRDLSDAAAAAGKAGPVVGQVALTLKADSWVVLEAVGSRPMYPVVTGTEEPFLLVSDAVGALAGPLGIAATTDIGAVVVGNPAPYALTNPVWIHTVSASLWKAPGVVPFKELNVPEQDPGVGVLRTRNSP